MQDKKITSEQNRLKVLKWLHRFGWLTSRQLAELVWPEKATSLAMAQRTIASMVEAKLLIKRKLSSGGDAVLLASKGAALLDSEYGISAKGGAQMELGNHLHRAASNWYLIRALADGEEIFTEYEIQSGRVSIPRHYGKMPDGLISTGFGVLWLETENSWKNKAERDKIVQFSSDYLGKDLMENLWDDYYLFGLQVLAITKFSANAIARSFAQASSNGEIREMALNDTWMAYAAMSTGLIYPKEDEILRTHRIHELENLNP